MEITIDDILAQRQQEYQKSCDNLQNVVNNAQSSFDSSYRRTFPDDFNFDRYLMCECPEYHEALLNRDNALENLKKIQRCHKVVALYYTGEKRKR